MPAKHSALESTRPLLKAGERNGVIALAVLFMGFYGLGWWAAGPVATVPAVAVALGLLAALAFAAVRRVRNALAEQQQQTQALLFLAQQVNNEQPLPAFDSGSLLPDAAATLVGLIRSRRPRLVVELGSGTSTLIAAYCLRDVGEGRLVSLEHDPVYGALARDRLRQHGLASFVQVIDAPLAPATVNGREHRWYDLQALDAIDAAVDLLIVDGPPRRLQHLARYPALPLLLDRLAADAVVLVDDANRSDEREMLRRWQAEYPAFRVIQHSPVGDGTSILERRSGGEPASHGTGPEPILSENT